MAKVLVVDDDPATRLTVQRFLHDAGYNVVVATDGDEALKLYRVAPADAVLTDIVMPGKEGMETIPAAAPGRMACRRQ